uniref:hypothetical protein n=1 Tax=Serratia proteamaculans TaxID=28151 RepID=UPI001F4BF44F|nr:hypothetical protein [Serratia proteamaculans]
MPLYDVSRVAPRPFPVSCLLSLDFASWILPDPAMLLFQHDNKHGDTLNDWTKLATSALLPAAPAS